MVVFVSNTRKQNVVHRAYAFSRIRNTGAKVFDFDGESTPDNVHEGGGNFRDLLNILLYSTKL